MVDPLTGRSRGFGFVQYRHFSEAARAISAMNGYQLENKYLKVAFKTPAEQDASTPGKPRSKRGRPGRRGAKITRDANKRHNPLYPNHYNENYQDIANTPNIQNVEETFKFLSLEEQLPH